MSRVFNHSIMSLRCLNGLRKRQVFRSFVAMRCQGGQSRAKLHKVTRIVEDQAVSTYLSRYCQINEELSDQVRCFVFFFLFFFFKKNTPCLGKLKGPKLFQIPLPSSFNFRKQVSDIGDCRPPDFQVNLPSGNNTMSLICIRFCLFDATRVLISFRVN